MQRLGQSALRPAIEEHFTLAGEPWPDACVGRQCMHDALHARRACHLLKLERNFIADLWQDDVRLAMFEQRCAGCHGTPAPERNRNGQGDRYFRFGSQGPHLPLVHQFTDLQMIRGRIGYYQFGNARPPQSLCNLTRPDKSLVLRAPLARDAGGLAWCGADVFADTGDPGYQAMLAAIVDAANQLDQAKRFDMPGFRPNAYYLRQMQQYGVLPADLDPDQPIDFRAIEEAYWRSFHYDPPHRLSSANP